MEKKGFYQLATHVTLGFSTSFLCSQDYHYIPLCGDWRTVTVSDRDIIEWIISGQRRIIERVNELSGKQKARRKPIEAADRSRPDPVSRLFLIRPLFPSARRIDETSAINNYVLQKFQDAHVDLQTF